MRSSAVYPGEGGYSRAGPVWSRPRYGIGDLIGLTLRQLPLMIVVFLALFVLGAGAALMLPKTYTAGASLFVRLGQEYVYEPRAGDAARGAIPAIDDVVQSEVAILNSRDLHLRVIRTLGLAAFDPELETRAQGGDAARALAEDQALRMMRQGLEVSTAPESGTMHLAFKHERPDSAALILNKLIETYLAYRLEVFADDGRRYSVQRTAIEDRLRNADDAYARFLQTNGIGDFAAAKAAATSTYQTVFGERASVQSLLEQSEGRLNTLRAQLAGVPPQITLQQDLNLSASDQLLQLRTEREQLLSRYLPTSQPVRDIEARIAQLDQYVQGGTSVGTRDMRLGPNPVWQDLEGARIREEAERDALVRRRAALDAQLAQLNARLAELTDLESRNVSLAAERDVLQSNIREFAAREAQTRASADLARAGDSNVVVIERAAPPSRGTSLKRPALALAFLFAAFTALCVGLGRVLMRRNFQTAGSAGRTLAMPVLAVAPDKR
ncbi:chain-length determining protein [Brevundimonas sp. 2R-24]|uniref:Chain-length determining protein n=1 Tax=Peiella sedimenti TaxID=3061083 RepID=A0ABT8SR74_9CAUL|nr:chain-length determining protein [Caulobacteraceae bacterium XZ-24]